MTANGYMRAVLVGAALFVGLAPDAQGGRQHWTLDVPGLGAIEEAADGMPVVVTADGRRQQVRIGGDALVLESAATAVRQALPADALPDAVIMHGHQGGAAAVSAWLDQPTTRHGHAVLGDGIEAGGLRVRYADGTTKSLTLPADRVFEDRVVRFTEYDFESRPVLMTVTSYLNAGAALTLVDPGAAGGPPPRVLAEAPPIGTPNRWLNPVGAGDVDGDGRIEFLAVITPHIGGTLTAYEHRYGRLVAEHELDGFSNHAYGSRELGLSGLADLDSPADGVPEAIVPDAERRSMTVVRFTDASTRVVSRLTLARGRISHRLVIRDLDGDAVPELTFGTDDGTVVVWSPGIAR